MAPNVVWVHNEKSVIGEGPHWDQEAQVLYYVDLLESAVIKYDPNSKKVTRVILDKEKQVFIGFVIPVARTKDKFIIGYGKKFAILTWDGVSTDPTSIEILVEVDSGTDNLINDGKADAKGRLWAGTMFHYTPDGPEKRGGSLYSLGKGGKTANSHVTDVGISNGLAWSSDNKTFYYIDSLNFAIDAFDYNIDSGTLSHRRTIFDLKKNNVKGLPDGMAIDREDKLWFATFGASAVHQIDPITGSLLQTVRFPASKITSVTWGGLKLDELYVTSGNFGETDENPYSGRLFKVTGLGASGFPGVPVKL